MQKGNGNVMTKTKLATIELRKIKDLKNWEDNPRIILEEDFKRLGEQIDKLGMYKTLLVNQDNIVLGGNQRLRHLKNKGYDEAYCSIVHTNSVAEMLEYSLSDNDQAGVSDDLKLAEMVTLNPIQTDLYKIQSNVLRPLGSIVNPIDPTTLGGGEEQDQSKLDEQLDGYLQGNIKQIVLYYSAEEYANIVNMLANIGRERDLESHTDVITAVIKEAHERAVSNEA